MGFDGIPLDSYARAGFGDSLPDIQTLAAEFAHRYGQFFAGGVFWLAILIVLTMADVATRGWLGGQVS